MALVDTTLQTALFTLFNAMSGMTSGGDIYMAKNTAVAIKTFVLTAQVSTVDAGLVSVVNVYAGNGTGSPGCFVIDSDSLESDLYETFTKENTSESEIADGIADAIDSACSQEDIISTTTSGTLTPPPPATPISPYTGTGKGTFNGSKSIISEKLLQTFTQMKTMTSGGDLLFATDFAKAVGDYLRGGTVSVELDTPIVGSGSGGVS